MSTTKTHIFSEETGLLILAELQNLVAAGTTRYDAAIAAANGAVATANATAALEEYDRQVASGVYGGRDLSTLLADEVSSAGSLPAALHLRAQAMNAAGIRVGDYADITPTVSTVNKGNAMRARIAGIAHNYQFGDTACPWAFWFLIDDPIDMTGSSYAINTSYIMWKTTANNNGSSTHPEPYLDSNIHAWELGQFLPALPSAWQNVLINHRILFEKRYNASSTLTDSTDWGWGDAGKVFSLSETEVYGQCVWGTKGYSVGADAQLPLFRDSRWRIKSRAAWWLRSVVSGSSSDVCTVYGYGTAGRNSAANTWVRPRPCFLVG